MWQRIRSQTLYMIKKFDYRSVAKKTMGLYKSMIDD